MHDVLGPGTILGYCTNVHAGSDWAQTKANLERHALAVKAQVSPHAPMGVGLWLSAATARELIERSRLDELRDWFGEHGLAAYTFNGFPYGDFHQPVVKHDVYRPDWSHRDRVEYTMWLARILASLLPEGGEGSISTLPLGWAGAAGDGWADNLLRVVEDFAAIERETGRLIHLDIEPEPGCEIGDTQAFIAHMERLEAMSRLPGDLLRRHLRVCHDVCHAAVMFERPAQMLEWCRRSGFRIGKVQISSAPRALFTGKSPEEKRSLRSQLERFVEPRYLHQTAIGEGSWHAIREFHEDLPRALATHASCDDEWRVHFHLPVYLETLGHLETTQEAIIELLRAIRPEDEIRHFEVETYAWGVLPAELQVPDLAAGIARELHWVKRQAQEMTR